MTGFGAQTSDIGSTASAFQAQVDPIIQQAERLQSIKGNGSTTGRDYAAQGNAYFAAISGPLEAIIRQFGEECMWVSTTLTDTKTSYEQADSSNSANLKSSGSGT